MNKCVASIFTGIQNSAMLQATRLFCVFVDVCFHGLEKNIERNPS